MTRDASENFHICQQSLLLLILLIFVKIVTAIEIFLHKVYLCQEKPSKISTEAPTPDTNFRGVHIWEHLSQLPESESEIMIYLYKKCESKILKKLESEIHMSQLLESESDHVNSENLESRIIMESIHKWEHLSQLGESESQIDHIPDNMQSVTDFNTPKLPAMTFYYDGNSAWHGDHYNDDVHWTDLKTACLNSSPWNPLPLTSMLATMKFRWLES